MSSATGAAGDDDEVIHDFAPLLLVYRSGRLERPIAMPHVPPGRDAATGVVSRDVTLSPHSFARLYLPPAAASGSGKRLPVVVYFHGGGFVIGSAGSAAYHRCLNDLAAACPAVAVSVDYRLAPEHPVPAAYEDSLAALRWALAAGDPWLAAHGDPARVFLAGDSAGGNICHHLAMHPDIRRGAGGLRGVVLIHPWFWGKEPIGGEPRSATKMQKGLWEFVCPGAVGGEDDPRMNPTAPGAPGLENLAQNPNSGYHRRGPPGGGSDRRGFLPPDAAPPPPPPPPPPPSAAAGPPGAASNTTSFRILCPECKAYGFPSGFIAKVRDDSGALVTVHPPFAGDYVRIIETVDGVRREADGRPPMYSPAQEALLMVHRRILETEAEDGDEDGEYGPRGKDPRDRGKTTTRLIVPKLHVGCLLGKGGKIIEQMRMETKTHIRILPRDQNTPRCVSLSEEVVQVVGDGNCVRKAVAIITDRLKESLHRDRGPFRGRMNSPEPRISQEDEYLGGVQQMPVYEETYGRPDQIRNNISLEPPGYEFDSNGGKVIEHPDILYDDIVFRILCPNDKASSLVSTRDGIIEMLQADVGVDVRLTDIIAGSDERVVIITSREGPDHELFPAQEALLHIQTHVVDLGPDKDNIITTRLLVPSSEIACFDGREGSLSDIQRQTSANVQILPREDLPLCALESDELIQIVGEIRAARNALMQVTTKLRSYLYREMSGPIQVGNINVHGAISPATGSPRGPYQGNDIPMGAYHQAPQLAASWHSKDSGGSASGSYEQGSNINDDIRQNATKRFAVPLVTRSTLEVVIPNSAVASLTMRAGSKLAQISEMSGATVKLADDRPDVLEKVVQISGTPEQTEKAKSLLQGFILSIQDDS